MKRCLFTLLAAALMLSPVSAQEEKAKSDQKSDARVEKKDKKDDKKAPPVKTRVLKAKSPNPRVPSIDLKIPVTWKEKRSTSRMRSATLEIPPVKGDKEPGELTVIILGPQPVADNVKRWIGQFQSSGRKQKVTHGKLKKKGEYYLAELSGTYKKPDGPPFLRKTKDAPGYRMLAVMIPTEGGAYFLKLTGPDKTVAAQAKSFRNMFGADAKTEKLFGKQ